MHKQWKLLLAVVSLLAVACTCKPDRLIRMTVINKSGRAIELSMTGKTYEEFYYLRVPEGDRFSPTTQIFSVVPDVYATNLYYVELWDPVYGNQCGTKGQTLSAESSFRLMVLECDKARYNAGEAPSLVKYGGTNVRGGVRPR